MSNEFDGVLRQGDYVKNYMDDDTYHKVAQAFLKAGCPVGEYRDFSREWKNESFVGWSLGLTNDRFFHGRISAFARLLTVDQVLSTLEAKPTPWRGPQDGLPPVGTECIYKQSSKTAYIVAHHMDGEQAIWSEEKYGGYLYYGMPQDFTPIQTERDKAIEAAIDILGPLNSCMTDHKKVLGALYDAGWRQILYTPGGRQ